MQQPVARLLFTSYFSLCIAQMVGTLMPSDVFARSANVASAFFAANDTVYAGGRGLISLEGISGLFLNPTSGTLARGTLTLQYCAAIEEDMEDNRKVKHAAMVAYGINDWLEVGAIGRFNDEPASEANTVAAGPLLRLRVLKDERWWPELSVGGLLREGDKAATNRTLFVAASKGIRLSADGFLRAFRVHGGFRQFWQDDEGGTTNGSPSIGYIGSELEFPARLFLIAEVSTKQDASQDVPFAFGLQWRHPQGFGFSLAGIQTGKEKGLYVGIGIPFRPSYR